MKGLPLKLLLTVCLTLLVSLPRTVESATDNDAPGTATAGRAAYQARDFETAFAIYSRLAGQGDARSQTIVAIMHRYGEGVPADPQLAHDWYLKAARQGYGPAQYSLADMLLTGEGIPIDQENGLYWMEQAAETGHARAIEYLKTSGPIETPGDNTDWSRNWDLSLPSHLRYPATTSGSTYFLELGVVSEITAARILWQDLSDRYPAVLSSLAPEYWQDPLGNDLRFHLQAGQFTDRASAKAACAQLAPDHCLVVKR